MRMTTSRTLSLGAAALTFVAALCAFPASAADDKSLQNMKGSVSYGTSNKQTPLAPNATTVLDDKDFATTGAASLAAISLPDSSQVLVGADSNVSLRRSIKSPAQMRSSLSSGKCASSFGIRCESRLHVPDDNRNDCGARNRGRYRTERFGATRERL